MSITTYLTSQNYQNFVVSGGVNYTFLDTGTSSLNTSIDWSLSNVQELYLDNSPTLTFTGATAGQYLTLILEQDSVGVKNINWPANVRWQSDIKPNMPGLKTEGTRDTLFSSNVTTGFSGVPYTIATQSSGNLIIGGAFFNYNGQPSSNRIVRLINNSGILNGKIDVTFNSSGYGLDNDVWAVAVQSDDKIVAGGDFTTFGTYSNSRIIRFTVDGTNDNTFNNSGFNGSVFTIAIQSDGKILVGGSFTSYGATTTNRIARLNSDGTIDATFTTNIGAGFGGLVRNIKTQDDGKIVVVGYFTAFDIYSSINGIVRLNSDGTYDNTFTTGTGLSSTSAEICVIQPDGKILVGGSFNSYNSNTANYLVRINTNGSHDSGFLGGSFSSTVRGLSLQSDGKIIVGGDFYTYGGYGSSGIIRLNSDGLRDSSFVVGAGFNIGSVQEVILDLEGKVVVVGQFSSYNLENIGRDSTTAYNIVRLNNGTQSVFTKVDFTYTGTYFVGNYA